MYNGIGLQTARGSGTNGYVQTNRFLVKPRLSKVVTDPSNKVFEGTAGLSRKANKEILEHDRKRQIQLKLLVLEEKLTDQGYTDSEIAEKMEEKRRDLEAEAAADALEDGEVGPTSLTDSKISDTQTHQIAARKERQMETLRAALGIGVEIQNKRYAMLPSDSEDSNNEDEPANGRKKDGNSKKNLKDVVDDTSDLRTVKKSRGNESAEDTLNESSRHKKQKSGRGRRDDSSDSDEKVVKRSKKRTQRKTSSDSDDKDTDAKKKKKTSRKSRSTRRRHDSDSSDSGSDTDSSSDSDGGAGRGRSLKKDEYHKREIKEVAKKPRKTSSSSETNQSDDAKKKKFSSKKSSRGRRHDSDSSSSEFNSKSSSDSGSDRKLKKSLKKHDSDVHGRNDQRHGKSDLEIKSLEDSLRRSDRDLNDRRRIGKENAHGDDQKAQHERDSDGLDTLRNLEKLYQPKEEKMVKPDRVGKEPNISKRKVDDGNSDEQRDSKSKRRNMSDLEYKDEVKHSVGGKLRSENPISDRWGAEPARIYDVVRRESGEGRERQGRKHKRDEEEDTPRINDKDREQQQPERNRREQDDRQSNKYDRERDHDTAKRSKYDDSRSGRRYDEDDDRHGRKHSDGRHDDRRSRR